MSTIVWFRRDLRLSDNAALNAAVKLGRPVVPVFIWAPHEEGDWEPGAASRWWLHHSLEALMGDLAIHGTPLVIRTGSSAENLRQLAEETKATHLYWNDLYEPLLLARDSKIKREFQAAGLEVQSFEGALLADPRTLKNSSGKPYQVFTPYFRALRATIENTPPLRSPKEIPSSTSTPASVPLEALSLLPKIHWDSGLTSMWVPGERSAEKQLTAFLRLKLEDYDDARDKPATDGTSRLSPHLHFGEISPRDIWYRAHRALGTNRSDVSPEGAERFVTELGWREFAHHLLVHFPQTPQEPLRPQFKRFPWNNNQRALKAWQRGETGYPIVDAGMRQLWHTGWMHNRVRMIVGSFLVKDLLIPWQLGAKWFWDTLVDASLANNTLGWQWISGCGADAAPYFRIFNPVSQGQKFDPEGEYVSRWVPELAALPRSHIHRPWEAKSGVLEDAGFKLGRDYPRPMVDHSEARLAALEAFESIKGSS